jgi:hypothetical protein
MKCRYVLISTTAFAWTKERQESYTLKENDQFKQNLTKLPTQLEKLRVLSCQSFGHVQITFQLHITIYFLWRNCFSTQSTWRSLIHLLDILSWPSLEEQIYQDYTNWDTFNCYQNLDNKRLIPNTTHSITYLNFKIDSPVRLIIQINS